MRHPVVYFPGGYVARLDLGRGKVLNTKDISMRNCITPGCIRTFSRHEYPPCIGGEKEHHSNQCATWHRIMKRKTA